jgi:hypothetical protein
MNHSDRECRNGENVNTTTDANEAQSAHTPYDARKSSTQKVGRKKGEHKKKHIFIFPSFFLKSLKIKTTIERSHKFFYPKGVQIKEWKKKLRLQF